MEKVWKDYRKESRSNLGAEIEENRPIDRDSVKLGAILRIADAAEVMARNFLRLQSDLDTYKRWHESEQKKNEKLQRQVNAYRRMFNKRRKK